MTIILYKCSSEPNKVDKNIYDSLTFTGTLRESCSIVDPTFTIDSSSMISPTLLLTFNYCYITEFNRYYFIRNITIINNNLFSFECHVDVLMTYRAQLRGLTAIISRQEKLYNLYLPDDKLIVECDRDIHTYGFPNNPPTGSRTFVLTVAGG